MNSSSMLTMPKPERPGGSVDLPPQRLTESSSVAVRIPVGGIVLPGDLTIPRGARGVVLFAHGSGSSRHSPRNQFVARVLQAAGSGTLLFDLLTPEEEEVDEQDAHLRFDIALLAGRLVAATRWLAGSFAARRLGVGYFGSSTGAAAALVAAAELGPAIHAVVSRGGRPDLAGAALPDVTAPTLLIVGECDDFVLALNREVCAHLRCLNQLVVVPRATHLFEEPGALDQVASAAAAWFRQHWRRD
jgi:pimeloyl-ACP methyl ester carboxylesterase